MTTAKTVLTAAAFAVCCLAGRAEDRINDTPRTQRDTLRTDRNAAASRINKASTMIGMEVKNPQNEKLGTIKDLAFDLRTGRIAYAVLSTGGVLGIGDKLVAIPTAAFQTSPDEKHLILNADKAKMETAVGFDKNNWPSMPSASWGADINVDTDRHPPKSSAIEKRHDNEPTVQDLKRQAQERNPSTEPKRPY